MAHSFQTLSLALLITSAASANIPSANLAPTSAAETPLPCTLQARATDWPAWNIPAFCECNGFGDYATTTITGLSTASPTGTQLCPYSIDQLSTLTTITPDRLTCKVESASTGFTVPATWCGCTAAGSTVTYSTKYQFRPTTFAGAAACSFMQDEVPAGTISPSAARCVVATAVPGGPFYNEVAWCACADNAPHPLLQFTQAMPATAACDFTTAPSSTITLAPLAVTSCQPNIWTSTSSSSSYCECGGAATSIRYPTGASGCVFPSVPTQTATVPSLVGVTCPSFGDVGTVETCDYDGRTIVSGSPDPIEMTGGMLMLIRSQAPMRHK